MPEAKGLEAKDLHKHFHAPGRVVRAVDGISFAVKPGQRLGLVGRSGSGKSTLGLIMAMLLEPDSGELHLDGVQVRSWGIRAPQAMRRRVQMMWQSPRLGTDPRFRLRQIILEPLAANRLLPRNKDERSRILHTWADRVGLTPELLDRFPHEVSDGQLQRACLARALILEPPYLICDEMSSMLDVSTQAALLDVLRTTQAEREMGIVLITHDHVLAEHWCDHITEIDAGKVVRTAQQTTTTLA